MNALTTAQFPTSLISTIIQRVTKSHLSDHLTSNNLVNPYQSAYCKHHSTETALLYIHHHLINAIGSRKISCLCLLDLPLIPLTTISYSLVCPLGLAFMALHLTGSHPIFPHAVFVLNAIIISSSRYLLLWCPPRLSSRPPALCHVYHPAQYSCFISCFKSPPLRR